MNKHLVLTDFDGTLVNTYEDSPSGWNVEKASRVAIEEVLGEDGLRIFNEVGGVKSRAPIEIVRDTQRALGNNDELTVELTKSFVDKKLSLMIPAINEDWPRLYPGVHHFLRKAGRDGYWFDVGILSSGHDLFIRRVLDVNGINSEDLIIVTSDSGLTRPFPERDTFKPNPYQLAEAHHQWLMRYEDHPPEEYNGSDIYIGRSLGKPNMLYVGDDPTKDGGLAEGSRIPYIHVPFTHPDFEPSADRGQLAVRDFIALDDILDYQQGDRLGVGHSFAEVLFGKADKELFPPPPDGEVYRRILGERSFV